MIASVEEINSVLRLYIWIFGEDIDGMEVYMKIHVIPTKRETQCICISFHEAEYELIYPYR